MTVQRILFAVHHYPPHRVGGAELQTQRIARGLTRRGLEVRVVCIENVRRAAATAITARDEMDVSVHVRRLDMELAPHDDLRLWFDAPLLHTEFETLFDSWRPDVVHLMSGYLMGIAPLRAAQARNIPAVVTLTDFWYLCPTIQLLKSDGSLCRGPVAIECARCLSANRRIFRTLDKRAPNLMHAFWSAGSAYPWLGGQLRLPAQLAALEERRVQLIEALNHVDALLPVTDFVVEMHRQNGLAADIPSTQIDCFDVADFDAFEPRVTSAAELHFGYMGQVTPIKGVEMLVRAFLQLRRARPDKRIYLHMHGNLNAEPSFNAHLRRLSNNTPEIIFHGAYEHRRALALLNDLDAVIVPSLWYENVPRVILEAFAAGRPIIGTRLGGITEVVSDGVNGLLFDRGNVDDLVRVLQQVVDDPEILARLAENIPPLRPFDGDMESILETYEAVQSKHAREMAS